MVTAKTQSGVEVRLEGVEHYSGPMVRVEFTHPKVGSVQFESSSYGRVNGQDGIIGWIGTGRACVTVPREAFDAAMAEARAIGERELEDIRSGKTPITVSYHDGEYLSGYAAGGREAELLVELGLAKQVDGWGTHVEPRVAKALGESFTYAQAAELARPELEAKRTKRDARDRERQGKFDEARRTGKRVLLSSCMDECDGSVSECSSDHVSEYALPNGSTTVERTHTY